MPKQTVDPLRDKRSILYETARGLGYILFRVFLPIRCHGREKLNAEAPYLLIANHVHALDPVAMAWCVPKRQVVFVAKKELGKNPLTENMLSRIHCILVDRHHSDMTAMRKCMEALRKKRILLIFPEGTRHHEGQMEQIENGTSLIALRSGVPIIPVYIDRKMRLFRPTNLYVGDPIPYDDLKAEGINAETCERMNERFRETYREMIRAHSSGT